MSADDRVQEQDLIRLSVHRDAHAFEQLMALYERRIWSTCLRMMGREEDAADVFQETMLRIWRTLPSFAGQSSLSTWIYRVTTNICLDALRKRKNDKQLSLDALSESGGFNPPDEGESPTEHVEQRAREEAIDQALMQLSPELRAAFILRDMQGESYEDVAGALNVSLGTAKSRIHRARLQLAKRLQPHRELFFPDSVQREEGRDGE